MIEALLQNIETELRMLTEISKYAQRLDYSSGNEEKLLLSAIDSLIKGIKIINSNVPQILESIQIAQPLPTADTTGAKPTSPIKTSESVPNLKQVRFKSVDSEVAVTLQERDRERFLRELSITDQALRKIKQRPSSSKEVGEEIQAVRGYLKTANKFFLPMAIRLVNKGYFKSLSVELRKANLNIIFTTYVAMMLFSTLIFCFVGLIGGVLVFFLSIDLASTYFIVPAADASLKRFLEALMVPILVPILTFFALYYYPSSEKNSLAKKIDQELPFAVIHMSAISGSGIEPTQIFKIIGLSKEYPVLRKEIRKILNQINLYGYDLITALTTVASSTPSSKLSDLFLGLSTTITSGGSMGDFFEKRAETLLIEYRLEREKYTKVAETFMDIYISLVIAAPMILMIILVIISVARLNTGLAPLEMTLLVIFIIGVLNAAFIAFLHFKQPVY